MISCGRRRRGSRHCRTEPPSGSRQMWSERPRVLADLTLLAHDDVEAPPTIPWDAAAAAVPRMPARSATSAPGRAVRATWRPGPTTRRQPGIPVGPRSPSGAAVVAAPKPSRSPGLGRRAAAEVAPPPPPALIHGASQNPWAPPMGHIHGPAAPPVTQYMTKRHRPAHDGRRRACGAAAGRRRAATVPSDALEAAHSLGDAPSSRTEAPPSISEGDGGFCDGKGDLDVDATSDEEESDGSRSSRRRAVVGRSWMGPVRYY